MKTYCLTLPETPARTEGAKKHFADMGVLAEFVPGIHAKTFGLFTVHPYEVDHPDSGYMIPPKHVGCALSHYMLWTAFSLLGEAAFLVVEDDVEFPAGWRERLYAALRDTPADTDMLYVGSCCCKDKPTTHVAGDVWDVRYPLCTHAYVLFKKALPILLATQRYVYAPIDISLVFRSLPQMKVFTVLPTICKQRGTPLNP